MPAIEVHVPIAPTRVLDHPLAPRLRALTGARVGWLDNLKANAGDLLRSVEATWRASGHAFESVTFTKNATAAAPDAVMAQLAGCAAVVIAIAD